MLCKDKEGMRGFRMIAEVYKPKTNWTKLTQWVDKLVELAGLVPLHGFIYDIERELNDSKPYRIEKK